MKVDFTNLSIMQRQAWLQHAVAPRPIAFASTIDKEGQVNLSPFSFFNLFSSNPPIIIFSPARSGRDNRLKHTLQNVLEVPEVVVHICDYDMVQQVSLSSCEYPKEVDEFLKAGFQKESAHLVRPPMVKEAKIKLECRVQEVKSLGDNPGAGQLVIAEVLCMHVNEEILNADQTMIDTLKMHYIARMGGDYYAVMNEQNIFTVPKPNKELGIGVDALPSSIRNSTILSGNDLGQLANVEQLPEINPAFEDVQLKHIVQYFSVSPAEMERELHLYAKQLLQNGNVQTAWQVLLAGESS